jgi:hypothetical protein
MKAESQRQRLSTIPSTSNYMCKSSRVGRSANTQLSRKEKTWSDDDAMIVMTTKKEDAGCQELISLDKRNPHIAFN